MRALVTGGWVIIPAILFGCSDDGGENRMMASSGASAGSSESAGAGADEEPDDAASGSGGAAGDSAAESRRTLCEAICATEAQLPCAMERAACLEGWCDVPTQVFPQCLLPYDVMLDCMAPEPLASYECVDGSPFPKEETCAQEVTDLTMCLLDE